MQKGIFRVAQIVGERGRAEKPFGIISVGCTQRRRIRPRRKQGQVAAGLDDLKSRINRERLARTINHPD